MTRCCPVVIFLSIIFTIVSCASQKMVEKPPPSKVGSIVLAKDVDESGTLGTPMVPTYRFNTEDKRVAALVTLENVSGSHDIRWEWVDPNGDLYLATDNLPIAVSEGKYLSAVTAWHQISVKGEPAADLPGDWSVRIFIDGEMIHSQTFFMDLFNPLVLPEDLVPRTFPEDWALIVGIEDYYRLPSVPYARTDAQMVENYFNRILGVPQENIISLTDAEATQDRIEDYLKKIIPANIGNDTTLYIYFAGHGMPGGEKGEPYLVPYDADTNKIEQTGYALYAFYQDLRQLATKRVYVFLDSCFNGVASRSSEILPNGDRPTQIHFEDVTPVTNSIVSISSTAPGEVNHALVRQKHGLFTYYLLWGLKGEADTNDDGWTCINELFGFVHSHVTQESNRMQSRQTPMIAPSPEKRSDVSLSRSVR